MNRRTLQAVGWTLLILALCSIPGVDIPFQGPSFDKVFHVLVFAVFGYLWLRATTHPRRYLWVFLAGVAYAVGTEYYQGLLPWERTPDVYDALADILGTAVGMAVYAYRNRQGA